MDTEKQERVDKYLSVLLSVKIKHENAIKYASIFYEEEMELEDIPTMSFEECVGFGIKKGDAFKLRKINLQSTLNDVEAKLKEIKLCDSPSTFGRNFEAAQYKLQFGCHRPSDYYLPHVSLYNETFNTFLHDLKTITPTETDSRFVIELCQLMGNTFKGENRRNTFSRLFSKYMGSTFEPYHITRSLQNEIVNDGAILAPIGTTGDYAMALSIEVKNELGATGACAFMEAVGYHACYAAESNLIDTSCLPAFLCILVGPYFQVYGTVFNKNLHVDPLTTMFPLMALPNDLSMIEDIAKCFASLKKSVQLLFNYYKNPTDVQRYFPCFTRINDNLSWRYVEELGTNKQVWRAKTLEDKDIVVKFSERFTDASIQALNVCMELSISHKLIGITKWGKWTVVVTEYVPGIPLSRLLIEKTIDEFLRNKLISMAKSMHDKGIVHGDLRACNIIIKENSEPVFIDFDYAGEIGKVKYPLLLNPTLPWPNGVASGNLVLQEHDIYWLTELSS